MERKKRLTLEKYLRKNFPNLSKDTNLQIQELEPTPIRIDPPTSNF